MACCGRIVKEKVLIIALLGPRNPLQWNSPRRVVARALNDKETLRFGAFRGVSYLQAGKCFLA
ncbi:MAG: hypothetical protein ACYS1A_12640 [Planctomycetota bacterium]